MKTIFITLAILLLALTTLAYTLPIYTLGVLISNVELLPEFFQFITTVSFGLLIFIGLVVFLAGSLPPQEILSTVKLTTITLTILLITSIIIKPFIPKDKETAMVLIGAQVLYDSDTARSVATQGADLLKRSVNVFAIKLKQYEQSLESNTTKE